MADPGPLTDAPLVLVAAIPADAAKITGHFGLRHDDVAIPIEVTVPAGPTAPAQLLPVLHGLCNKFVAQATRRVTDAGKKIACKAGCGACCRQAVPVTPTEARALAALVAAMPAARRATIEARFAAARARLADAGIDRSPGAFDITDMRARVLVANAYFQVGVACPFLEDESCSIHSDRPLVCREYLVTSDPANCASRTGDVDVVPIEISVSNRLIDVETDREITGRLFLIDALEWAAANPAPAPTTPGPALLMEIVAALFDRPKD